MFEDIPQILRFPRRCPRRPCLILNENALGWGLGFPRKTWNILEKIGKSKTQRPKFLVGFAAETGSIDNAKKKLVDKKCDMMVYNKIDSKNKVFGSDYNRISIITKNQIKKFKKMTKVNCAKQIIKQIYNSI